MPMPPCCAMAIARRDSVTVSMAALSRGVFRKISRVRRVWVSTWAGTTSLRAGTRRTSSKVSASGTGNSIMAFLRDTAAPASFGLRLETALCHCRRAPLVRQTPGAKKASSGGEMSVEMRENTQRASGLLRPLSLVIQASLLLLLPGLANAQTPTLQHRGDESDKMVVQKEFVSGGEVDFKINSGNVRIVRNHEPEQIRLEIHLQTKGFDTSLAVQKWVRAFDVQGNHASIALQLP